MLKLDCDLNFPREQQQHINIYKGLLASESHEPHFIADPVPKTIIWSRHKLHNGEDALQGLYLCLNCAVYTLIAKKTIRNMLAYTSSSKQERLCIVCSTSFAVLVAHSWFLGVFVLKTTCCCWLD